MKPEDPLPAVLQNDPIVGTDQAAKATNVSPTHLRRLAKAGKFPPPLKIGDRKFGWRLSTIARHIASRETAAACPRKAD
jgi:predicted DNA-binding transcriptional regulator AlpA